MTSACESEENESDTQSERGSPVDVEIALHALQQLLEAAEENGRDWKLIDALLITLTSILEEGPDVLAPSGPKEPRRRLRPEYKAQVQVVVDSLSDDETAHFLGVGPRQVRRRAHEGALYYFRVGKRRRYPAWQFDERLGVLPGLPRLIRTIPGEWSPERAHRFMTGLETDLKIAGEPIAPRTWLMAGLDPSDIIDLLRTEGEQNG